MSAGIRVKLLLLSVVPTVLAVALVAGVLTTCQTDRIEEMLRDKTHRYAEVAAIQLRSAVGFDDRETARETLDGIMRDPEVVGVQLYGATGAPLHGAGRPVMRPPQASGPVELADAFVMEVPVVSLEGPVGAFVVMVSKDSVARVRRHVMLVTAAVGVIAILIALSIAMPIDRRLSRRIRNVARYATRVAQGELRAEPLDARGSDELAQTAAAVNAMVVQVRELIDREAERAASERERLESMVRERTEQLEVSHRATRLVLDHVNQGLFTVTYDGIVVGERSRATDALLGETRNGDKLAEVTARHDDRMAAGLEVGFFQLASDVLPLELAIDQLPRSLVTTDRVLTFAYTPVVDPSDGTPQLLVTVTDTTAERDRELARAVEEESSTLFRQLASDRHGLTRFLEDARDHIDTVESSTSAEAVFAALHTLKGNAGLLGLQAWVERCHAAETAITENGDLSLDERRALAHAWETTERRIAPMLRSDVIEIPATDFTAILALARKEANWPELRAKLTDVTLEPTRLPLRRLAKHVRELAARYQRQLCVLHVDDHGLRLDPDRWGPMWSSLTHVVRNVVVHGMDPERPTSVALRTKRAPEGLTLEITDDGMGINWTKLTDRARDAGLPHATRDDLIAAMFASGVSTRDVADETAGRGVGLAAVAATCHELGVRIEVLPRPRGTMFRFHVPLAPAVQERAA